MDKTFLVRISCSDMNKGLAPIFFADLTDTIQDCVQDLFDYDGTYGDAEVVAVEIIEENT